MKQRLVYIGLFVALVIFLSAQLVVHSIYKDTFTYICKLVEEKFVFHNETLETWTESCLQETQDLSFFISRTGLMRKVQLKLNQLGVSHLNLYDPKEDRRVWVGEAVDTGIRVRAINGRFVIYKIYEGSPAHRVGLLPGDEILYINEQPVYSLWQIQTSVGDFYLQRGEQSFTAHLIPEPIYIDDAPSIQDISSQVGLLRISSFRSQYFERQEWLEKIQQFKPYTHLIIDVRGNSGGDFVAMIRALSPFFCERTLIGRLVQPRRQHRLAKELEDNIESIHQFNQLEEFSDIPLKTYKDYGCFRGSITVLMDEKTASVAEIFASAFFERDNSRVWGGPTAGDVLLAVWYDVPHLGAEYSLSIPEATFQTLDGQNLEGVGVWPEKLLFYDLEETLLGKDSFVEASRVFH